MNKNNATFVTSTINESINNSESWDASSKKEISKTPSSSTITNTVTNSTFNSIQPDKIPTLFEWKGSNKSVFITGSFCNWKKRLKMNFIQTSSRLILGLPPGKYQYKYIVDGEWQYSKDYPTVLEQGVTNNVIEVISKAEKAKKDDKSNSQSTPLKTPIERVVIPCPDMNMLPISLSERVGLLPQVLCSHALFPSFNNMGKPYISLFSTSRVRVKTISVAYYKPTRLTK